MRNDAAAALAGTVLAVLTCHLSIAWAVSSDCFMLRAI
jgi:hypothetical protein